MKAVIDERRTLVLLAWGAMDAIHIVWYSSHALLRGHMPYFHDLQATWMTVELFGFGVAGFALAFWTLEASLLASAWLLLKGNPYAKYLGYAQIPLRLWLFIPSVSLVPIAAAYLPMHIVMYTLLVLASEFLKGWSLNKYA